MPRTLSSYMMKGWVQHTCTHHTHMDTCTHTHTHTRIHAHTHTHTHAHTHTTHTHTHTHTLSECCPVTSQAQGGAQNPQLAALAQRQGPGQLRASVLHVQCHVCALYQFRLASTMHVKFHVQSHIHCTYMYM